jgi:hypothetical protein
LRREADAQQLKLRRLADAQNITRDFIGLQGQANQIVGERFGDDPFRGAILSQGAVPRGRSPVEEFIQRLRELGGAEIPAPLSADESLPMIEERIAGLEGLVTPGLPRAPLGMAHGGTVQRRGGRLQARPLAGGDGAQADLRPGTAVLVGEGVGGEGIRNNTAEVAEFMEDGSVRFIPLRASAAHGGTVDIDDPDAGATLTSAPALADPLAAAPLTPDQRIQALQGAGIGAVRTGPRHFFGQFRGPSAETFERLGTRPALVQAAGTGEFFFRTPTGELQKIGGLAEVNALGLNSFDAVVMDLDEIQQLGEFRGERFTEPPPAPGGSFSERPVPLFVPLDVNDAGLPDQSGRGIFLPAPEKLAAIWRNLGPDVQLIARSTYKMAGMSEAEFDRRINFFTPGRAATLTPQPARFA